MGLLNFDTNNINENALLQAGLGIMANNQGHGGQFAPAFGQGTIQGLQQANEFKRKRQEELFRQQQFAQQKAQYDQAQANRLQDRQFSVDDRNTMRGYQVEDKAENRGFQVADKAEARNWQVADTNDAREFERLQDKEKFGQQLTLQEQQFKQAYGIQKQAQNFQAGQNAISRNNQIQMENLRNRNKPSRGMSAAAQKELIETDDATQGSKQAVKEFNKALKINNSAMGGVGSSTLATIGSILPDSVRPNAVDATKELDNVLQGSALPQLKSIFGGMPTEGERAILLEVQGSSSQPAKVREGIFNRAIEAANNRIRYNTEKSKQLRNGTYFTEDGGVSIPDAPTDSNVEKTKQSTMSSGGWSAKKVK